MPRRPIEAVRSWFFYVGYFGEGTEASLVEAVYWHPSQTEDPASVWLCSVVQVPCSQLHELVPVTAHPVRIESPTE
ncbi:MAG: hypothetical protein ABWY04_14095 [Arthrobacter sp.]